ncbi:unnamed protein product [Arctia plantaginis]|uniref:Uncharacterized protein n=1 Tax=Arctia plantaginis TaxID=874455 RepID=A0A8S1BI98_ARCPL|nr:unnamed protein product [Arctia plantaginis]CAB3258719.1 unnamed protein product [Arctia plantaginis]
MVNKLYINCTKWEGEHERALAPKPMSLFQITRATSKLATVCDPWDELRGERGRYARRTGRGTPHPQPARFTARRCCRSARVTRQVPTQ